MSRIFIAGTMLATLCLPFPAAAQSLGGNSGSVSSPAIGSGGSAGTAASPGSIGTGIDSSPAAGGVSSPAVGSGDTAGTADSPGSIGVGIGSSPAAGGVTGDPLGAAGNSPDFSDIGAASNELRATEGSTTIGPVNAGAIARTGDAGAASAVTGANDDFGAIDIQPAPLVDIPAPRIGVDLGAIRNALSAGSTATPKPNGD